VVRDITDVRAFYHELGGKKEEFDEKLDNLEDEILDEHKGILRKEIPKMLKNPVYRPYMKNLVDKYVEDDIINKVEEKYFKGNLKLQELDDELKKVKDKKKRRRLLGGHRVTFGTGLDKTKLLKQFDFGKNVAYDPVNTLLVMKMDPLEFGISPDEIDSLTLLEQRQALAVQLRRLKVTKGLTEEQKYIAKNLGIILEDSKKMGEKQAQLAKKGKKVQLSLDW
jgi:hypothetical protein